MNDPDTKARTLNAAENEMPECPSLETMALLIEGKLDGAERKKVLLHIADCSDCAMTYSIAGEAHKESIQEGSVAGRKPVLFTLRYFTQAAAIVLLAGASFFGGFLYARGVSFPADAPESAQSFESSPLYWSRLDVAVRREKPSEATRIAGTRGAQEGPSVQEILTSKKDFDRRLGEIAGMSGRDVDTILSVDGLDILTLTSLDIEVCASLLKDGRAEEMKNAGRWIVLDQSVYFSLVKQLPPDVWERYPFSMESLKTLSWIAGLPKERKEEILALSPEEAARERQK